MLDFIMFDTNKSPQFNGCTVILCSYSRFFTIFSLNWYCLTYIDYIFYSHFSFSDLCYILLCFHLSTILRISKFLVLIIYVFSQYLYFSYFEIHWIVIDCVWLILRVHHLCRIFLYLIPLFCYAVRVINYSFSCSCDNIVDINSSCNNFEL